MATLGLSCVAVLANSFDRQAPASSAKPNDPPPASFVGSGACLACHTEQAADWNASQHRVAMQDVSDRTVLGDFNGASFNYAGVSSQFTHRNGKYYVRTDGPDGKLADYEVKYTFGVQPLQQYLVELSGGRVQALSIAWDSRPANANGQRWFHLYPNERVTHGDELHWTQPSQNWNFMCADCHSTGVRKNYDRTNDRYQTTFAETSVGCEACHGPASRHMAWALAPKTDRAARGDSTKGLNARLTERHAVYWRLSEKTGNAKRSRPRHTDREIETCAQCHSRRSQIADGYEAGKSFLDYYRPALLTRPLYGADGQQHDEVYTWGSFLQSKMYSRGVTCSDCHNPHSGKPRAAGNAVCATCHLPAKYDTTTHHRHQATSTGASCVGCHMPASTYMVIDPRHDHSLRIPRPDLSITLGTPNACTSCHVKQDARWAAAKVAEWYPKKPAPETHERAAVTFAAVDSGGLNAQAALRALASDETQSAITRATAFAEASIPATEPTAAAALESALRDPSPLVRFGALQSLEQVSLEMRVRLAEPLLADAFKANRLEAVRLLAAVPVAQVSAALQPAFNRASNEFIEAQRYNADRVESRVALGTFLAERGDAAGAVKELQAAIKMGPQSIPSYVNLADVYRVLGRDADGERVLQDGLLRTPNSSALHYALGLVLTRLNRSDTALREFARAAGLEPGNARFAYVHAIALNSAGKVDAAIEQLRKAVIANPTNGEILSALASIYAKRGDAVQAKHYAERLRTVSAYH